MIADSFGSLEKDIRSFELREEESRDRASKENKQNLNIPIKERSSTQWRERLKSKNSTKGKSIGREGQNDRWTVSKKAAEVNRPKSKHFKTKV